MELCPLKCSKKDGKTQPWHFAVESRIFLRKERRRVSQWVGLEKINWIQNVVWPSVDTRWGRAFYIEVQVYRYKIHFLPWGTYILGLRLCLTGLSAWHFIKMMINNLVNGRTNLIIITCDIEAQSLVNTVIKSALVSQQSESLRNSESRLT